MFWTILFSLSGGIYAFFTLRSLWCLRWVRRLPPLPTVPAAPPRVSIVFAARDEAARVEQTVRHALAQRHIDLEILPVSDRSTDGTDAILHRLAAADSRVRPQRVDILPEGWLGKCHACHLGASRATGDWLLFTDADCWLKPDVVARAIAQAEAAGVDHITLTPGVAPHTAAAHAWHVSFLLSVADWIARVNRDHPRGHLGVGAFNLIRAEGYRKTGGFQALRMTVVEDVKFGKLVRRAGMRTRAFMGGDDVECHWGWTVPGMIKLMEKNYFAALNFYIAAAIGAGPVCMLLWAACVAGPFTGTAAGLFAGAALLSCIVPAVVVTRRLRWPWRYALWVPFVFVTLNYAILRSAWVTLRQGGIRWRDTFYPLATLRAGNLK